MKGVTETKVSALRDCFGTVDEFFQAKPGDVMLKMSEDIDGIGPKLACQIDQVVGSYVQYQVQYGHIDSETDVVHCKESDYDVYIGRDGGNHTLNTKVGKRGWLGNPHPLKIECGRCGVTHDRFGSILRFGEDFQDHWYSFLDSSEAVNDLQGKTLGCWCKPKACHGDVIVSWIE